MLGMQSVLVILEVFLFIENKIVYPNDGGARIQPFQLSCFCQHTGVEYCNLRHSEAAFLKSCANELKNVGRNINFDLSSDLQARCEFIQNYGLENYQELLLSISKESKIVFELKPEKYERPDQTNIH